MLPDSRALRNIIAFLSEYRIPYMIIGGVANSIWGRPRATHDADFKVSIDGPLSEFRKTVLEHFPARHTNIPAHKLSPHVIHVWALPGVAADFLVSIFDYEKMAIDRSEEWKSREYWRVSVQQKIWLFIKWLPAAELICRMLKAFLPVSAASWMSNISETG